MAQIDDYKVMLTAIQMSLYLGCALVNELPANAANQRMMGLMYATSQVVGKRLEAEVEIDLKAACIETRKTLEKSRQHVLRQPCPVALREARAGWLEGAKKLIAEMENVQ